MVFFATLAVLGLRRDEISPVLILISGLVLSVVLILTCAVVTKRWGIGLGWFLQLVIIAGGFLEPTMFLVGAAFAVTWLYGIRQGTRIDRENVERDRLQAEWEKANPE